MGNGEAFRSLFRDSLFGRQIVYRLSGRRLCKSFVEQPNYQIPEKYLVPEVGDSDTSDKTNKNEEQIDDGSIPSSQYEVDANGYIIVDWDSPEDPENPQNWPLFKKVVVSIILAIATTSLYSGSAIYTPAIPQMTERWGASRVHMELGLTLFVWGYGIGSLWSSPMSENPRFGGRNYVYLMCQFLFVILQIPTALVNHVSSFSVLRLLAGFCASPMLSTAAASYADMISPHYVPYALIAWSMGAVAGPVIAPLIGAALVHSDTWRWVFWFLLILGGVVLGVEVLLFPETSHQELLMRRAANLRRMTGNDKIVAPGDLLLREQKWGEVLTYIFWQPIRLTLREPILLLLNIHLGLTYSIVYLYFEAFPLVYGGVYGFGLVTQGTAYLSLLVGIIIAAGLYMLYLHTQLIKPAFSGSQVSPDRVFGNPSIFGAVLMPAGLIMFGWTSTPHAHWIGTMISNAITGGAIFTIFQSNFALIGFLYPPETAASAFASSNLVRSLMAGAFPLFGSVMFEHTSIKDYPVGFGALIMGLSAMLFVSLPIYLRIKGKALRESAWEKYGAETSEGHP